MDYRTRIKAGNKNYIYADQLKFFLNRSSEEKTKQDLEYFVELWAMYNAIDEVWKFVGKERFCSGTTLGS